MGFSAALSTDVAPYLVGRALYNEANFPSLCMVSLPNAHELSDQALRVIEVPTIGHRACSIYKQCLHNDQSSR